ncbi:MAG: methyltetrahydrofolate cobalamin methyltransferase [Deltaproteobacteria bacterium]|nr:methyltetrahydrofolate cobalamin methyltransferase [Deltaproteobacteria bacterium]
MYIVGELINASRKNIASAIGDRNSDTIKEIALAQDRAGADLIDVNAGVFKDREAEHLQWIIENVRSVTEKPCCIDSPDPKAIEAVLSVHQGPAPMINSISLEKNRWNSLLPILTGGDLQVVALCISDEGMPETADERLKIADRLINGLVRNKIPIENIFVDPLVQPLATNSVYGTEFINAIERIMNGFPGVHTICGLSNISYGLPERKLLNQTFMIMAITKGLDSAIIDPLDKRIMGVIKAAEALRGRDEYCRKYLGAYRAGLLNFG